MSSSFDEKLAKFIYDEDIAAMAKMSDVEELDDDEFFDKLNQHNRPLPREVSVARAKKLLEHLQKLSDVASLVGSNTYDMSIGCWNDNLNEGDVKLLDKLQGELYSAALTAKILKHRLSLPKE